MFVRTINNINLNHLSDSVLIALTLAGVESRGNGFKEKLYNNNNKKKY